MAKTFEKQKLTSGTGSSKEKIGYANTREVLIRCGMELLTEQGFAATGLDAILKRATVPKGSFYYYFGSKEDFGREVIKAYDDYFSKKLEYRLSNETCSPLERLAAFVSDAKAGMAKYRYTRGCLVGNLSQELEALPESYRSLLHIVVAGWEARVSACLKAAQVNGEISSEADCDLLAMYFWIGWEGAVMRSRLVQNGSVLDMFIKVFLAGLPR